jgi:hypothetical protein
LPISDFRFERRTAAAGSVGAHAFASVFARWATPDKSESMAPG